MKELALLILFVLLPVAARAQAQVELGWSVPPDAIVLDKIAKYSVLHAGPDNTFTNVGYAMPGTATNWVSGYMFPQGAHQFMVLTVSSNGLSAPSSNIASTSVAWAPHPIINLVVRSVSATSPVKYTNATVTISTQ